MRDHYHDLKYTSLVIFNELVAGVRRGTFKDIYRKVLETSKVIEESTLMEERMKIDINFYKSELIRWHVDEGRDKMAYRIPTMAKTFVQFRNKKSCYMKDYAIEIVTKMYRIDMEDRIAVRREIEEKRENLLHASEASLKRGQDTRK